MNVLIVEDDFISRKILMKFIEPFGEYTVTADGEEAVRVFEQALDEGKPFDLVCLDIMLPKKDGRQVLLEIRQAEMDRGIWGRGTSKVVIMSALHDAETIVEAFRFQCEGYLCKPIRYNQFTRKLEELELLRKVV